MPANGCTRPEPTSILGPLTDRSIAQEERRRQILDAAVRVFARSGYHGSRVGDIAQEAGVAHGLLYHYFSSKEEVLQTVFRENWGALIERFRAVEGADLRPRSSRASPRSFCAPGATTRISSP